MVIALIPSVARLAAAAAAAACRLVLGPVTLATCAEVEEVGFEEVELEDDVGASMAEGGNVLVDFGFIVLLLFGSATWIWFLVPLSEVTSFRCKSSDTTSLAPSQ